MMKKHFLLFLVTSLLYTTSCKKSPADPTPEEPTVPIPPPVIPPPDPENQSLFLGNPSNATDQVSNTNNYLIDEGYYALSYSKDRGIANWVSWHVQASDFGSAPRQDDFRANERIPDGWYKPDDFSYSGYGFDRGHIVPSSDRTASVSANSSTFLMTNIFPQAPSNNQVTWANFETYCRNLVTQGNELYITSGNYGAGGTGNSGFATTIDNGRITVPAYIWKVVLVLPLGTNDLSRITTNTRVISVIMPNENNTGSNWKNFRVPVDQIETETGYNLLSAISQSIQDVLEVQVDNLP